LSIENPCSSEATVTGTVNGIRRALEKFGMSATVCFVMRGRPTAEFGEDRSGHFVEESALAFLRTA